MPLFKSLIKRTGWSHCEPSMADADHVIKYLGQYTHRVAISNDRLLDNERHACAFHG